MNELRGKRIAILGCGAMGSALGKGLVLASAALPSEIVFSDPHSSHLETLKTQLGVQSAGDNRAAVEGADIVILAVKPFNVSPVLEEIGTQISAKQLIVSIAAGITIKEIERYLPSGVPVVRAMPNSPAQVNAGASALAAGTYADSVHLAIATQIFDAVGLAVVVPESLLDAVTALSGSGPAYVYLVIEALVDGGVKAGIPREIAHSLAVQTVLGSARMVLETGKHPAQLKDMVATPGGTTISALAHLEHAGMRSAFIEAVEKACIRSRELGRPTELA